MVLDISSVDRDFHETIENKVARSLHYRLSDDVWAYTHVGASVNRAIFDPLLAIRQGIVDSLWYP